MGEEYMIEAGYQLLLACTDTGTPEIYINPCEYDGSLAGLELIAEGFGCDVIIES